MEVRHPDMEAFQEWLAVVRAEFVAWIHRCTPLRAIVSVGLISSIGVWAVAFNIIAANANTPELANQESPRTLWSCKGRSQQVVRWHGYQAQLTTSAHHYEPASPYDNRARLLLLGDSITEAWRGTSMGEPRSEPWAASMPAVLEETLAKRWPAPLVQGISGDQTQHLLWRLSHGEISARMASDPRLVVVLMIGTNNLGMGHTPEQVVDGIGAVISRLLNLTKGRVLVNALLPRGDGQRRLPALCPPNCAKNGKPLRTFRPLIERVNALLNLSVGKLLQQHPGRLRYADCGKLFDPMAARRAELSGGAGGAGGGGGGALDGLQLISGGARAVGDAVTGVVTHPTAVLAKTEQAFIGAGEKVIGVAEEYLSRGASDDVRLELMPDRLHPNADGYRLWAACVEQAVGDFGNT